MTNRIDEKVLIDRIAQRTGKPHDEVKMLVEVTFEEIYEAFKREERVSIRNFGSFYIKVHRDSTAFKFNPSQKLRALLGWSSTYTGDL